jgi:hypothetical protein
LKDYHRDGEEILGAYYEPELEAVGDKDFFPVEKVIRKRTLADGRKEALVKFVSHPAKFNRWLPMEELEGI